MADDLKYGYKGAEPTQSFGNNTGVFDPNDINNLIADRKWTSVGSLELIETQTGQSTSADILSVNFESIKETEYDVHFLTFSEGISNGYQYLSLQFGNNGTYTTSGYVYSARDYQDSGSYSDQKSTSASELRIGSYVYQGENAYCYIYNIGDSSKYTYTSSMQSAVRANNAGMRGQFGNGSYPSQTSFNNIKIKRTSTVGWYSFKSSLYGIKLS